MLNRATFSPFSLAGKGAQRIVASEGAWTKRTTASPSHCCAMGPSLSRGGEKDWLDVRP